jgi:hypothetical protein
MKFNFFTKKGRPTLIEKEVCKKIANLIKDEVITESQIEDYVSQNGMANNFEELEILHAYLTGEVPLDDYSNSSLYNDEVTTDNNKNYTENIEDDNDEFEEQIKPKNNDQLKNQETMSENGFNPFEQPVIERDYTKGIVDNVDETLYEDAKVVEDFDANTGSEDFESYEEDDIPQAEFNNNPEEDYMDESDMGGDTGGSSKLAEGNLQDLSPAQKRKSAEKTADAMLGLYCKFVPAPFKQWASFKERKINELSLKKEIDLEMELDGELTIKDYIDNHNKQVEGIFEVSEEQKNEIREPLIDVLLEQELALTPTQRLLMAVGGHLTTLGISAFQLAQNNKMALETFKQFQSDKIMSSQPYQQAQPQGQPYQQARPQAQPYQQAQTQTQSTPPPTSSGNNFDEMTAFDTRMANEIMDIIDAEHDPNVSVENTMED